jgi:hypothetical protein
VLNFKQEENVKYIIMMGQMTEGFSFVGPFDTEDEAKEAAQFISGRHRANVLELVAYDKDNLPLLPSDLQRMYSKSR